jgi:hypothetical protein
MGMTAAPGEEAAGRSRLHSRDQARRLPITRNGNDFAGVCSEID